MIDPFGRTITYLRVSVTDRCDFRCVYCMAEEMSFLPKSELLTLEELDRVCSAFVRLGVRKLRLTGGEPLVRRNIMTLFRSLGRHLEAGALDELTLTTNGSQLARYAGELASISREGQLVERAAGQVTAEHAKEGHDVAAHQRFAARQAQLFDSEPDKGAAHSVEFFQGQQLGLW